MNWYKKAQAGGGSPPPPPPPPPPLPPLGGPPAGGAQSPSESRVGTIGAIHKGRLKGGTVFDKDVIDWLDKTFKDFYSESGEENDVDDSYDGDQTESPRMKSARIRTVQLARVAPPDGIGLDVGGPNCLSIANVYDEKYPDKEPPFVRGILCPESASSNSGSPPGAPPGAPPPPPPM
jgi:hypothetical protein